MEILTDSTLEAFVDSLKNILEEKKKLKIVVLSGAGISTAAKIPDFRSPITGLYANLQKYNLPYPEAIFDIDYFLKKPSAFYELSRELFPGTFHPTLTHYFIKLLHEKGHLQRNYTQNIDMLERLAGIDESLLVEAHGSFHTAQCVGSLKKVVMGQDKDDKDLSRDRDLENTTEDSDSSSDSSSSYPKLRRAIRIPGCGKTFKIDQFKEAVFKETIPRCDHCQGLIKPNIVFFGEQLPDRFHSLTQSDFPKNCDALIVLGTSLTVMPFAGLINRVDLKTPRLLINLEEAGVSENENYGFDFTKRFHSHKRDAFYKGSCDDGVAELSKLMGWKDDLDALFKEKPISSVAQETKTVPSEKEDILVSKLSNVHI